ncbi:hypothetical protein HU200_012932 [Digitaria exilis]|uniref:ACT domain-containing protein ACR n=1 Tax=Digitaria exilis TaxID=1010633 RepID=A0A835KLG6_9POAL|nr:hypothetical protein HU200_012932 [Digitaria exilis]
MFAAASGRGGHARPHDTAARGNDGTVLSGRRAALRRPGAFPSMHGGSHGQKASLLRGCGLTAGPHHAWAPAGRTTASKLEQRAAGASTAESQRQTTMRGTHPVSCPCCTTHLLSNEPLQRMCPCGAHHLPPALPLKFQRPSFFPNPPASPIPKFQLSLPPPTRQSPASCAKPAGRNHPSLGRSGRSEPPSPPSLPFVSPPPSIYTTPGLPELAPCAAAAAAGGAHSASGLRDSCEEAAESRSGGAKEKKMEWLDEYEKLVIRMNTPKVVIDNGVCPTATLVQVDSARKRGVLLEAVQVLADLDLSINKAYISSDGRWFMDVFHVTDRLGRKLTDDSVISYIQQSLGTWNGPASPTAAMEGLTALELTGRRQDGPPLRVQRRRGSRVDAPCRLACVVFLRGEDTSDDRVSRILARLGHLPPRRPHRRRVPAGAVAQSPPPASTTLTAASTSSWPPNLEHPPRPGGVPDAGGDPSTAGRSEVPDRPKLLFDVVCTLHDMDYVVFHGTVDTTGDQLARQEFYIRHADGSPSAPKQREKGSASRDCSQDVTRTFRENGLLVAQAEVSTKGDVASNVFYVTDAAGEAVDQSAIDAVRERVGTDRLVLYQKPSPGDRGPCVGGLGLVYLGNFVKRNLYNLGLIKSCS